MEPLIAIHLRDQRRVYCPGDPLHVAYQVDAPDAVQLFAVEASVLWYTVGKGEEDMSVHFFERRQAADVEESDLRQQWEFETLLPNSPLSYDGVIVKIVWCVRVRVFLDRGKEVTADQVFQLGHVPRASRVMIPQPDPPPADDGEPSADSPPADAHERNPA
jgi:hypothetical protein